MSPSTGLHAAARCLLLLALVCGCRAASTRPAPPARWLDPAAPQQHAASPELPSTYRDIMNAPERLWDDGRMVFGNWHNLLYLAGATAYAFAAESFEDREAVWFENHTIYGRNMQEFLGALGNGATLYAGALTWYFWARALDNEPSYEASKTVLSAMTVTAAATGLLKTVIQDSRPAGGSHDFPSGHSSMSMAVAASLDELYGHMAGFPAYAFSFLIGLQRLDIGKHDTGSVLFGWVLGYVTGKTIAGHHAPRIFGAELGLTRDEDSGALGLSLTWTR